MCRQTRIFKLRLRFFIPVFGGLHSTLSDPRTLSDPETLQNCSLSDTGKTWPIYLLNYVDSESEVSEHVTTDL